MDIKLVDKESNNIYGIIVPVLENNKDKNYDLLWDELKKSGKFAGKSKELFTITANKDKLLSIVLTGLGEKKPSYRELQNIISDSFREAQKLKNSSIAIDLRNINTTNQDIKAITEAIILADYTFDTYKSKKKDEDKKVSVEIIISNRASIEDGFNEGLVTGNATLIARKLVDKPANIITPVTLAQNVMDLSKEHGFEAEVLDQEGINALNMHAFMSVARASHIPPRFIIMRYMGDSSSSDITGLIGKGLTYDAGGLSIKPTASMVDMKSDMAGSAAVIGAMCAISSMKLKKNVVAVVAACENMINGNSYRPGDIISSMGGKSIYIGNTDAEGRLTLIDAMHYIVTKEGVSRVIDIATLTGAAIHCTGDVAAPSISTDDNLFNKLNNAYNVSRENIWRMPIYPEYRELIKHEDADLTNTAGSPGTITAGLFIGEFTNELPWVHIDIAGPSMSSKTKGINNKGATGCGVRPLYQLIKDL